MQNVPTPPPTMSDASSLTVMRDHLGLRFDVLGAPTYDPAHCDGVQVRIRIVTPAGLPRLIHGRSQLVSSNPVAGTNYVEYRYRFSPSIPADDNAVLIDDSAAGLKTNLVSVSFTCPDGQLTATLQSKTTL